MLLGSPRTDFWTLPLPLTILLPWSRGALRVYVPSFLFPSEILKSSLPGVFWQGSEMICQRGLQTVLKVSCPHSSPLGTEPLLFSADSGGLPERSVSLTGAPESVQ